MLDENNVVWNHIWKAWSVVSSIGFVIIAVSNVDSFLDLDFNLFHTDFGFGWTLTWLIVAVVNLTANMLLLQLLSNVKKIAEKE